MSAGEIVEYLRTERQSLIFNFFDREGVKGWFDVSMSIDEWKDFIKYCSREDVEGVASLTEGLMEMWDEEKKKFPEDYNYNSKN